MDLSERDHQELRDSVRGSVHRPGEPGYDEERVGFNLALPQSPAIIVAATGAADVAAAVRFAASRRLPVSVQATGHAPVGTGDGAVLVSTRGMTGLRIDPTTRTARVEAGVRWQQVVEEAAKHGLAPLNGSSPSVGVVSYTLGGGIGPLARPYGWAADRVRSLDIVTADGELRTATSDRHPDLFWGVRGGKGNFGIVTALEFELVAVATIYGGGLFFAGESASEILHTYQRWTQTVPDEMTSSVALLRLPPLPTIPEPLRGRFVVHVRISYLGTPERGEELVAPLRAVGPRVLDTVAEMPYAENASIHMDPVDPLPGYDRSLALRPLDDAAIDALLSVAGPETDFSLLLVEVRHLGGALRRQPAHPNAVGNRDASYSLLAVGVGGPDERPAILEAGDRLLAVMQPWATGGRLLNFMAGHLPAAAHPHAWDPETYKRLAALKSTYDPDNLFRVNVNVAPAASNDGTQR
jgi:FAD binding domain/Berberine and berberine like